MGKVFLITRPRHDIPTSYLHYFGKEIIEIVKSTKDIHVTDLEGDKANRELFEKTVKKENPGLIFLNGHGDRKCVYGHSDESILDKNNIKMTKNKIIYALSCDSLEELGLIAIDIGAKAYIGYKGRFMIIRDHTREASPQKDRNSLPFKRACTALIDSLVFGLSVKEAIKKTKEEYLHSIRSYGTSEDIYGDAPLIRFALAWNLEFLDAYGDSNAVF